MHIKFAINIAYTFQQLLHIVIDAGEGLFSLEEWGFYSPVASTRRQQGKEIVAGAGCVLQNAAVGHDPQKGDLQ